MQPAADARTGTITDSDHVILSAIQTETIAGRAEPKDDYKEDEVEDDE